MWEKILFFMIYSFMGWMLEVLYRSASQHRFVNAGFLYGPFLPLYGACALITLVLDKLFYDTNIILTFVAFGIVLSLTEYAAGTLSERIFHLKLWDYRDNKFNFKGRVCLSYGILWAILAVLFIYIIHPLTYYFVTGIENSILIKFSVAFVIYISFDLFVSIISMQAFRTKLAYLYDNYINLDSLEIEQVFRSINRLLKAFPDINKYLNKNISDKFMKRVNAYISSLNHRFHEIIRERKPVYAEYYTYVNDILANKEFRKLKDFFHHNSSIYDHVIDVSYISYEISKYLNLNSRAAARGALLHDFFLYDWSNHDEPDLARNKFHGLWHPRIALKNAKKEFSLSGIEEDIIIKHMWPLTPIPPRYRESFIVTFVDKYVSSKELLGELKKRIKEKR